ncbi:UNVERIFIED_CONTAM: hypothetical protein Sradi_0972300 [Sesamum radiatum]|uniref:RNase H type-1 domain-containing protein n=1 Tax=Sesamum radiatum TaxID=300843 RepID=A0AAW2V3Q2_SESRA
MLSASLGIGVIARNHEGSCMAWRLSRFDHSVNPTLVECLAAREAISLAIQEGWQEVILEGYSRIVINMLNSCAADNSYIGVIVEDVQCLMRAVHNCRAEFVPRELNSDAYQLARHAHQDSDGREFLPSFMM